MRLTLNIEDAKKEKALINFLRELSFVEILNDNKEVKKDTKIDEIFGIWEGRNITKESLRNEAWGRA